MDDLSKLIAFLRKIAAGGFFGKLTISFQNGKLGTVVVEQVKKPDEL